MMLWRPEMTLREVLHANKRLTIECVVWGCANMHAAYQSQLVRWIDRVGDMTLAELSRRAYCRRCQTAGRRRVKPLISVKDNAEEPRTAGLWEDG